MQYLRDKKNKLIKNRLTIMVNNLVMDREEEGWEAGIMG